MRVSVAMATFNGERFLGEQLASLAAQTRPPDELVISDDGSTDATLEIVDRFRASTRCSVTVITDGHVGFRDNFLRAMAACSGDLIALSDQDDVWEPSKLELACAPFRADRGVWLTTHAAIPVDAALRPLARVDPATPAPRRIRTVAPGHTRPLVAYPGFSIVMRAAVRDAPPPSPEMSCLFSTPWLEIPHDVWSCLVATSLGTTVQLPQRLVRFRRHEGSLTLSGPRPRAATVRSSIAETDEPALYARIAAVAEERAAYLPGLGALAQSSGTDASAGLRRAIGAYRRHAQAMSRRAALYRSPSRRALARGVAGSWWHGDYGARDNGGLGFPSLVRDLSVGALRTAESRGPNA